MNIQKYILANPRLAKRILSSLPESYWLKQSKKNALKIYQIAKQRVPAYQDFLNKSGVNRSVKSIDDFLNLPIMDKKDYLQKYEIDQLCLDGRLWDKYTIEKSSGHSGKSFYWPRVRENDDLIPSYLEFAFFQSYNLDKYKTLIILTFALGTWTTGEKVADSVRKFAASGKYNLTVLTPGANFEETLEILEDLSPKYEQTVIVGYPPFIKSIVDEAIKRNINLPSLNIKIGLGGEGHSEHWREYIGKKLGLRRNDLSAIASAYGAADIGIGVGREYPLTILVRKLALKDKKLAQQLFGDDSVMPCLYQYNSSVYIEEVDGELVFTAMNGIPIVRYNIHDRGGIVTYRRIKEVCKTFGYDIEDLLSVEGYEKDVYKFPMFYIFGRGDGTISIGGANIYPENIEQAIISTRFYKKIFSYKLGIEIDDDQNARPVIYFELVDDVQGDGEKIDILEQEIHDSLLPRLLSINSDFKDAFRVDKISSDPIIKVFPRNTGVFAEDGIIKRRYIVR